jgi:hypothetical protein
MHASKHPSVHVVIQLTEEETANAYKRYIIFFRFLDKYGVAFFLHEDKKTSHLELDTLSESLVDVFLEELKRYLV